MAERNNNWLWWTAGIAAATMVRRRLREARALDFDGRVVVIAGGSRGLGLVLARRFAREGARLERARESIYEESGGVQVELFPCDVTDELAAVKVVDDIVDRFGRIDVLVNDAGIMQVGPFEQMRREDFERAMAVHTWGPLYLMQAAIPHMRRQRVGRIVNISSIGGEVAIPHMAPYAASKFALTGLSDALRAELSRDGIRVTTVCPGLMRTGSHVKARFRGAAQSEYTWFSSIAALPGVSLDADRAAAKIVEACRHGDRHLTVGLPARVVEVLDTLAPELVGDLMALVNRALPPAETLQGGRERTGAEIGGQTFGKGIRRTLDRAAERNNELGGGSTPRA
jgi:NAD(P)-dependent dehydrogenase (short-subunit alcohol dehydrogenase family)